MLVVSKTIRYAIRTFGDCFPILVGAFGAHFNIPALFREVSTGAGSPGWKNTVAGRAAYRRMMRVIVGALTLSSIAYGLAGLVVYATFGPDTKSDAPATGPIPLPPSISECAFTGAQRTLAWRKYERSLQEAKCRSARKGKQTRRSLPRLLEGTLKRSTIGTCTNILKEIGDV